MQDGEKKEHNQESQYIPDEHVILIWVRTGNSGLRMLTCFSARAQLRDATGDFATGKLGSANVSTDFRGQPASDLVVQIFARATDAVST